MARSKKFDELLIEALKDPKEAIAYLNAALEECAEDDKESRQLFLMALKNVAEAQGGISKLSQKTGLGRESLYKSLSSRGNPKLSTLTALVNALGFDLRICLPNSH